MTQAANLAALGSNASTTGILPIAGGGTAGTNGAIGFKNRIINGAMVINQRGVTSGVTSGYFVDRWTLSGCSNSSVLTSSLPTGFTTGISISATSGNPIAIQKIESKNCSDLSGQSVTLSFYAQSISNATTLYASLAYANSTDSFGSTTTISEQNLGTLTGSWVKYTYTWNNLPSGVLNGLSVSILCAGTSTFTMGITGVQLEVGTTATNFDFRAYGQELALCQRYFWMQATGNDRTLGTGFYYATTEVDCCIQFPVTMRSAPSVYAASGTNYYTCFRSGGSDPFDSLSLQQASVTNCSVYNGSQASGTAGVAGNFSTNNASTYVGFSAEL